MRRTTALLMIILSTAIFSCAKHKHRDCALIPAKILRYDCDRVILQLLTNEHIGDNNWTDVQNGNAYTNVASYYNTCQIASFTNGRFDTVYVKAETIHDDPFVNGCVQCMVASPDPPKTKIVLKEIQTAPCDSSN